MCLYTVIDAKPDVAESDIHVYKVVCVNIQNFDDLSTRYFESPFHLRRYKIGETYRSDFTTMVVPLDQFFMSPLHNPLHKLATMINLELHVGIVERGIHTFASLKEAQEYSKIRMADGTDVTVLHCVIPAGAEYYLGKWPHRKYGYISSLSYVDSYASSALKVIEEVV